MNTSNDDPVKCPKCGSAQIHAEKRGWNVWTGIIRSGKIIITCLKCGHRFSPGETLTVSSVATSTSLDEEARLMRAKMADPIDASFGTVVVIAILLTAVILFIIWASVGGPAEETQKPQSDAANVTQRLTKALKDIAITQDAVSRPTLAKEYEAKKLIIERETVAELAKIAAKEDAIRRGFIPTPPEVTILDEPSEEETTKQSGLPVGMQRR